MDKPSLIHLEHALPPLAELGLEHLVPALLGGGRVQLDSEVLGELLAALADGARKHAARRLVVVVQSTKEQLLEQETDAKAADAALRQAAFASLDEAREAITGFFSSLGVSLSASLASLETPGTRATEAPGQEPQAPPAS